MKVSVLALLAVVIVTFSCREQRSEVLERASDTISLKYAQGFSIEKDSIYTRVRVAKPYQGASKGLTYLLVPKGAEVPPHGAEEQIINIPVSSVICTSTTHIPLLDYLDETNKLVGFPTTDYISSPRMRLRIDEGKVADVGIDKGMNIEKIASLNPELLMGYTMTGEFGQFKKIEELGIPVVLNAEYLEAHPLGRAEWIKFMGAFFGKSEAADSVFSIIEQNYNKIKEDAGKVSAKPSVITGILYGDAWFLPGGKNYAAKLLEDAGYSYVWQDDPSHGFLQLSFESVMARGANADFWIGVGPYKSLDELKAADERYSHFAPFKSGNVYSYDARQGSAGGNEYLELGYLRPDIILMDLVKIAHPSLLPGHTLYFHRQLH